MIAAQAQVVSMFREIDVDVEWVAATPLDRGGPGILRLSVAAAVAGSLRHGAAPVLGVATHTPDGTGVAWAFYESIEQAARLHDVAVTAILASVMAHEIGHMLQGIERHSLAGLMRASWSSEDFQSAGRGGLRFSAADAATFSLTRAVVAPALAVSAQR